MGVDVLALSRQNDVEIACNEKIWAYGHTQMRTFVEMHNQRLSCLPGTQRFLDTNCAGEAREYMCETRMLCVRTHT